MEKNRTNTITVKMISSLLQKNKSTIIRRAQKESWPFKTVSGPGGKRKEFIISKLPEEMN